MRKSMATPAHKPQKALEAVARETAADIERRAAALSPGERTRRHKKTLAIAAKIASARREKR